MRPRLSMAKVKPSAAPRARIASRDCAICSSVEPYLWAICSPISSPSGTILAFSSKGWKWISAWAVSFSLSSACSSDLRPITHQGQETSETKSIRTGVGVDMWQPLRESVAAARCGAASPAYACGATKIKHLLFLASRLCSILLAAYLSFLAREQVGDILAVTVSQQHAHGDHGQQDGIDAEQQAIIKRCEQGCHQRGQRGIAEGVGDDQPGRQSCQAQPDIDAQQHPQRRRHALATDETEEDGPQMAEENGNRHQRDSRIAHAQRAVKVRSQEYGQPALGAIAEQGHDGGALVAAAQHIGRARILRAIGARIGNAENLAHHHGKRYRAEQVSGHCHCQGCDYWIHLFPLLIISLTSRPGQQNIHQARAR